MKHNDLFKLVAVLALLAMIVLTGCVVVTPAAVTAGEPAVTKDVVTEAELEAQIEEAVWVYEEAYQAGDMERVMALYTDDVVSLPPGFPKTEGKADLEAGFQEFFDAFTIERDFELVDVDVFGDTATRLGEWTQTLTPKDGGEPFVETGNSGQFQLYNLKDAPF